MSDMPRGQFKALLFGLAVLLAGAILGMTFVMGRMSSWVVGNDALNGRMDRDGGFVEHMVAELLRSQSGFGWVFIAVLFFCVVFLALLWHALFGRFDVRR